MAKVPKGTYTEGLGYKAVRKPPVTYWSKLSRAAVTFDPPSIVAGAGAVSSSITVTGAAVGDRVELFPPYSTQGIMAYGQVDAANSVKISLLNPTGTAIDLPSGTWIIVTVTP
ncbi:hypothetical protein [Paenibacillus oleatilyticus]|uniref:Uncharacterized protein n=1 Tax=Paenibacillus oleatilyticus TaxID=2594886 RepID=A0ABV4VCE2_9BACL